MDQQEVKEKIRAEISKTEELIKAYKDQSQPIALDNAVGRLSRMDAINNKSITEAALRKAEEKLSRLKHALANIDKKDFGLCIQCKKPIPIGRILLMPESNRCVSCAS